MKCPFTKTWIALLLLLHSAAQLHADSSTVAFDCPNMPPSEFQFDLDSRVIALVMEDPAANIRPLFSNIDNLHLRSYRSRSVNLKAVIQYYGETLTARGWNVLGQRSQGDADDDNLHLYTLQLNESVQGVFVIVKSGAEVYLINIVGDIPEKLLGELLLNLHQLGIELPELMSLKPRDLEIAPPLPTPPPEVVESPPTQPVITEPAEETPSLQETPEPAKSWKWTFEGKHIHDIQIQGGDGIEGVDLLNILKNGAGEITAVMPVLAKVLLKHSKGVTLRIEERDTYRGAIISVHAIPVTRTILVLKSLKISGSSRNSVYKSSFDKLILPESELPTPTGGTRFWAEDVPIHEIRLRGNQKISEAQIQQTLENGPPDIEQALKTLYRVMPYFHEVNLHVDKEDSKYIATITVDEKPLSTNAYLGFNPPLQLGFNRVTGWEIGTGFELGKRKNVGPLWAWNVENSVNGETSHLFGKAGYAFGNPHVHYRVGGTANWGEPYTWHLGLTAQLHRLTTAVAPELFPNYNDTTSIVKRVFGVPDFQDYYLRQGAEVAVRWSPVLPTHSFKLAAVTESHASLQKSTDWFIANWTSSLRVRENPPIRPGRLRSLTFQYDFKTRTNALGWYNTFLVEHSPAAVGSDFYFTRMLLHLRYAFPLGNNRIRTRFLFGFSNATLPIQRQFVIDGIGGLRGYTWRKQAGESEGLITYKSGHTTSRYAFSGDRGFLLNVEYHYRLSNLLRWGFFKNVFAIVFFDEGQVWNVSGPAYTFNPKGSIGLGLQFGEDFSDIARVNIAKAFESSTGIQVTTSWYHRF